MTRTDDLEQLVVGGHALARIAAQTTGNEAPAAQWRALSILNAEGPRRVGELANACRTTQPGMTRLIGQLEESKLVERTSDPHDSRATVVRVLPAGERALDAWRVQLRDALDPLFVDLNDADWAAIGHVARLLSERTAARSEVTR